MDEAGAVPQGPYRAVLRAGPDGHRSPGRVRRPGRHVLPGRARGRGTGGRGCFGGGDRGRAEYARAQCSGALGQRRTEAPLPAAAGYGDGRRRTRYRRPARARMPSLSPRAPPATATTIVLNGRKLWITNAYEAGVFLVFANGGPGSRIPRHHLLPGRARLPRLRGGQEGGQARDSRLLHLRADPGRLPRAGGERDGRGGQRLQGRDRDAERRAHRDRRPNGRPGSRRAGPCAPLRPRAQAVRQAHRRIPGRAVRPGTHGHRGRSGAPAGVQRGPATRRGAAVHQGSRDGEVLRLGDCRTRGLEGAWRCSAASASRATIRSRSSTATRRSAGFTKAPATCSWRRSRGKSWGTDPAKRTGRRIHLYDR